MTKSTIPRTPILNNTAKINNLRPENPFFKKYLSNKNQTEEDLTKHNNILQPNLINPSPTPNFINKIPSFENRVHFSPLTDEMYSEAMKALT